MIITNIILLFIFIYVLYHLTKMIYVVLSLKEKPLTLKPIVCMSSLQLNSHVFSYRIYYINKIIERLDNING